MGVTCVKHIRVRIQDGKTRQQEDTIMMCLVRYTNYGSGECNVIYIFWLSDSFKITKGKCDLKKIKTSEFFLVAFEKLQKIAQNYNYLCHGTDRLCLHRSDG
jgi:hypothetical protein